MKIAFLRILTLATAIIASLLLLEIGIRVHSPQNTYSSFYKNERNCYRSDNRLYAIHKTNTTCTFTSSEYNTIVSLNNLGLRNKNDTTIIKSENTTRILFLGDSFVFGQGVGDEENFPYVAGKYLESSQQNSVEVLNAGIVGSEPTYGYLYLQSQAEKMNPDIVVVALYLGNDLTDIEYFQWKELDEQRLPKKIVTKQEYVDPDGTRRMSNTPSRYRIPFLRESHLFLFLAEKIYGNVNLSNTITVNGTPCLIIPSCKILDPQIKKMESVFLGIKNLTTLKKQQLLVVIIPWELQLPRHITKQSQLNFFANKTNRQFLGKRFGTFFRDHDIRYLDLMDAFEQQKGNGVIFYPIDRHWTKEGHKIAGKAVAEKLSASFLTSPTTQSAALSNPQKEQ